MVGRRTVWNPATSIARLFKAQAEMMAAQAGLPSGIGDDPGLDEYQIDVPLFTTFVEAVFERWMDTGHPVGRQLTEGFLLNAWALLDNCGGSEPSAFRPRPHLPQRGQEIHDMWVRHWRALRPEAGVHPAPDED